MLELIFILLANISFQCFSHAKSFYLIIMPKMVRVAVFWLYSRYKIQEFYCCSNCRNMFNNTHTNNIAQGKKRLIHIRHTIQNYTLKGFAVIKGFNGTRYTTNGLQFTSVTIQKRISLNASICIVLLQFISYPILPSLCVCELATNVIVLINFHPQHLFHHALVDFVIKSRRRALLTIFWPNWLHYVMNIQTAIIPTKYILNLYLSGRNTLCSIPNAGCNGLTRRDWTPTLTAVLRTFRTTGCNK